MPAQMRSENLRSKIANGFKSCCGKPSERLPSLRVEHTATAMTPGRRLTCGGSWLNPLQHYLSQPKRRERVDVADGVLVLGSVIRAQGLACCTRSGKMQRQAG